MREDLYMERRYCSKHARYDLLHLVDLLVCMQSLACVRLDTRPHAHGSGSEQKLLAHAHHKHVMYNVHLHVKSTVGIGYSAGVRKTTFYSYFRSFLHTINQVWHITCMCAGAGR